MAEFKKLTDAEIAEINASEIVDLEKAGDADVQAQSAECVCPYCKTYLYFRGYPKYGRCSNCGGVFRIYY
ncbi:MAG: hypothetical protein E7053_03740 [Lentisphaerae bacterium]|nr:hypothetical protein [Lentisphaerota bacterium]